jgi:hypothetical protein
MNGYVDVFKAAQADVVPAPEQTFYMVLTEANGVPTALESEPDTDKDRVMNRAADVARWFGLEVRKNW